MIADTRFSEDFFDFWYKTKAEELSHPVIAYVNSGATWTKDALSSWGALNTATTKWRLTATNTHATSSYSVSAITFIKADDTLQTVQYSTLIVPAGYDGFTTYPFDYFTYNFTTTTAYKDVSSVSINSTGIPSGNRLAICNSNVT
jgi:hypothetical protein